MSKIKTDSMFDKLLKELGKEEFILTGYYVDELETDMGKYKVTHCEDEYVRDKVIAFYKEK